MSTYFSYQSAVPSSWKTVLRRYQALPEFSDQVFVTYVWVDGSGQSLRCKTRTLHRIPQTVADIPKWGFCGYGTYMSETVKDSNRILVPKALYPDPFHHEAGDTKQRHKTVLCGTYMYDKDYKLVPTQTNKRYHCNEVMEQAKDEKPWFGIEQEYFLLDLDRHPIGWPKHGYPSPMGPYYCSVGADVSVGRDVIDSHYKACMYAGINICGINSEACLSQWEFQTGPTEGIAAADELWMARYMLHRVAEDFCVIVSFDPKPVERGNWSGSGAHCNFSTEEMRKDGGIKHIESAIKKLQKNHKQHIKVYDPREGLDNQRRLTGRNETASIDDCSSGVEDRQVALRIPVEVHLDKKLFDRALDVSEIAGNESSWPKHGYPSPMGPYYCSVGADVSVGRDVIDSHYKACMYAGINICGINSEACLSQWEFQTGPTEGIAAADELWMARYMLHRVAEDFCVIVSFDPKPVERGNWSGSGAHCNFSTEEMRKDGGIKHIESAIKKLQKNHKQHIKVYDPREGLDNQRRLTGRNETASIDDCSSGVEDRQVALRIPVEVHLDKKGYLEDRRPAANCDPYDVTRALVQTVCLDVAPGVIDGDESDSSN